MFEGKTMSQKPTCDVSLVKNFVKILVITKILF